ncbi:MAG: hypothetical protein AAFR71_15565 [Pseudomonadota bacterium]
MKLSAPTKPVFLISVIVAIFALLMALNVITFIPVASVWIMGLAFLLLALANMLKGM